MGRFNFISFLFFLLVVGKLNGQTNIVVCGTLTDEDTLAVADCMVKIKGTSFKAVSDKKGRFYFQETFKKGSTVRVTVSDLRYKIVEKDVKILALNPTKDTIFLNLVLQPLEIEEVVINAGAQAVFHSEKINVLDFEFVDGKLLLLTYEKRPGNNMKLVLANEESEELATYIVDSDISKLEKDYDGKIHLIGAATVFNVNVYENKIYLLKENNEEYEKYLKPLVAHTSEQVYFSNYVWHYPGFSYYAYRNADSSYKTLRYVEDRFMMDLYRAEYKYVDTRMKLEAYRMQLRTGVDKEIWAAVWNGFPSSLYYKPIYAPMFVRHDSVMIFDHYANHLFYYDNENQLLDSVEINYHLGKEGGEWKKQMMMDEVTKKIYNVFEKKGTYMLVELDNKARQVKTYTIKHKYPEKIKVHNGAIYFNYRPFESLQNKYLYRQQMN